MKWWFSDYDGTINLDHNDTINDKDFLFIKKWIKEGNKLAIATGRIEPEIKAVLEKFDIPYDYIICNNGAMVYGKQEGLINNTIIPMESRQELFKVIDSLKYEITIGYCLKDVRMPFSKVPEPEIDNNDFLIKYAPKINNFEKGKKDILNSLDLNLIYFYITSSRADEIKNLLNTNVPNCRAVNTHENLIEVMHANVSKAHGIEVIQKIHNFSKDDVYTSGDGENDIEMLLYTQNSFAMENHQNGVEKAAKHIIGNVFEIENYLK